MFEIFYKYHNEPVPLNLMQWKIGGRMNAAFDRSREND